MEDRDKVIENLQKRYPEDLNDLYNCYWWYTQSVDDNKKPIDGTRTYYLSIKDKYCDTDMGKRFTCLLAHNPDPEKLVDLLDMYLKTCTYS